MSSVNFTVQGDPAPQGSKRAIMGKHQRFPSLVEDSKRTKPWRQDVRQAALEAMAARRDRMLREHGQYPDALLAGPLHVDLEFRLSRPKGHYGTGRNERRLKPSAPEHPAGKPDIDKLARAVLDALKLVVWTDDAQVVSLNLRKRYVPSFVGVEQIIGGAELPSFLPGLRVVAVEFEGDPDLREAEAVMEHLVGPKP